MKIILNLNEKRFCRNQVFELAIQAAQNGDRELHRGLMRLADKFSDTHTFSPIHRYEAEMLVSLTSKTLEQLKTEVIPKIEKSTSTEEEKAKTLGMAKEIVTSAETVLNVLTEKLNETIGNSSK